MINYSTSTYNVEKDYFSDDYIQVVIDYHADHSVFARRPLTTFFVKQCSTLFDLSIAKSFALVNFLLIFIGGYVVYHIARVLQVGHMKALLGQVFYHMSFTLLFAFFRTIYTYDEPFQYLFCLLSILAIIRNKQLLLIVFLTLSLVARESSIVALPSLFLLSCLLLEGRLFINLRALKRTLPYFMAVFIYGTFYIYHLSSFEAGVETDYDELTTRISQLSFNFQSTSYTIESIAVFFIVSLLPLTLLLLQPRTKEFRNFSLPFWVLLALNTVMVYISARVCESRVLTLPLIFLWPFLGVYFTSTLKYVEQIYSSRKKLLLFSFLFIVIVFISKFIAFDWYKPTGSKTTENWFNEYFFIVLIVSGALILIAKLGRKNEPGA